ncbi:hypothetical protein [Cupriavidus sp. TMH.W2]|uniref:hypothetical protein n=1 Tax=Cupriavidus sp. TMH.W2 TaxID=3434465 RepID=UPI003D76D389
MNQPVHAPPLLKALEAALFGMPTATKDNHDILRTAATAFLNDKALWQRIGESDRSSALVRVLRTLVNDPRGPGFEMLNEYEELCKTMPEVDGEDWHDFWDEDGPSEYHFPAPVSRLSELTRDEAFILRSTKLEGPDWIVDLMQRVSTNNEAYAPIRDLVMRRLDWVRSLNDADFALPVAVRYGRIRTPRENADLLWSFGVEVGHYDDVADAFHVRVNARAYRALQPYSNNFPLDDLQLWDDHHTLSDSDKHDPELLQGAKAYLTFLLHSHHGDGSAATLRSGKREHWQELLEEVIELQVEHAATSSLRRHTEGRPDAAPAP